jgi:cell wall-associated NlpC family hydrolase
MREREAVTSADDMRQVMRGRRSPLAIIAMFAVLMVGQPALADTPQRKLDRARERLDQLSDELEIQIEECNLRREQRKAADEAVAENRTRYRRAKKRLASVRDEYSSVVAQLYKDRSAGRQLNSLSVTAASLADYAERVAWLDITQDARTTSVERYTAARDRLTADADVLETTQQAAAEAEADAQRSCDRTRQKVEAEEENIAELAAEVERLERQRQAARTAPSPSAEGPEPISTELTPTPAAASGNAATAVQFALAQLGKPYSWGGSGPNSYDCSGLTSSAWAAAGVYLPHNSGMQYSATSRVSRSALQPGDLVFFGSPIHHVGLYIGNGQMVDAPRTGYTVRVTSIDRSNYVGAGRP